MGELEQVPRIGMRQSLPGLFKREKLEIDVLVAQLHGAGLRFSDEKHYCLVDKPFARPIEVADFLCETRDQLRVGYSCLFAQLRDAAAASVSPFSKCPLGKPQKRPEFRSRNSIVLCEDLRKTITPAERSCLATPI